MAETRLFDVAYGFDGEDQTLIATAVPTWEARRTAMTALGHERKRNQDAGNEALAETFDRLWHSIQAAEIGSIVFGHVERYEGANGRRMFIAILPTGTDYRDAGFKPANSFGRNGRPLFTPTEVA